MYELNEKIRNMTPYAPIQGDYPIRLDANESSHNLPEWLIKKIEQRIVSIPFHRYPDPYAKEVVEAFSAFYGISPQHVTAGNGSDELIGILASAFLQKGDTVLTILPDFSMYAFYSELDEAKVTVLEKGEDLLLSPEKILQGAKECGAKAIFLSNPCNPTGQGLTKEQVHFLINGTDALVVLDEAYMDFWDQSLIQEAAEFDHVICLKTCSKAIGLAALRLGFAVANSTITNALRAVKSPYNVNSVTQAAGAAVLLEKDYLLQCTKELIAQRQALYQTLLEFNTRHGNIMRIYPSHTNFVFIKTDGASFVHQSLLKKGIAVRCMGDYLRISAPTSEELPALMAALNEIFEEGKR